MSRIALPPSIVGVWLKHHDLAIFRHSTFPVTAPGSLGNSFQRRECTINQRKINIHASLNTLGGNPPAAFPSFEPSPPFSKPHPPMLGTKIGGEMENAFNVM